MLTIVPSMAASMTVGEVANANTPLGEVAQRLKQAVESTGGPSSVSRRSGIPLATLRTYLNGRDVRLGALVALADACGVTVEWLATGRGPMHSDWITASHPGAVPLGLQPDGSMVSAGPLMPLYGAPPPPGYVAIPRYNVAASAGGGALVSHPQVVEYMAYGEEYLATHLRRRADDLVLVEARGDSMEPTIRDGDVLTLDIRPDQPLETGRLYVLQIGDALLVKRLELRLQSLVLHSDNPRYKPETLDRTDIEQLHVVGQVLLVTAPPR